MAKSSKRYKRKKGGSGKRSKKKSSKKGGLYPHANSYVANPAFSYTYGTPYVSHFIDGPIDENEKNAAFRLLGSRFNSTNDPASHELYTLFRDCIDQAARFYSSYQHDKGIDQQLLFYGGRSYAAASRYPVTGALGGSTYDWDEYRTSEEVKDVCLKMKGLLKYEGNLWGISPKTLANATMTMALNELYTINVPDRVIELLLKKIGGTHASRRLPKMKSVVFRKKKKGRK